MIKKKSIKLFEINNTYNFKLSKKVFLVFAYSFQETENKKQLRNKFC